MLENTDNNMHMHTGVCICDGCVPSTLFTASLPLVWEEKRLMPGQTMPTLPLHTLHSAGLGRVSRCTRPSPCLSCTRVKYQNNNLVWGGEGWGRG